jgi:hypothetical protein
MVAWIKELAGWLIQRSPSTTLVCLIYATKPAAPIMLYFFA